MNRTHVNRTGCERESEVAKAERAGARSPELSPELLAHVESCAECAETRQIARVLQASAERSRAAHAMPSAGQVWFKAQKRAREAAIRRAMRSMRVMQLLGALYALALAAWGARALAGGELNALAPAFKGGDAGFAVLSSLGAVACMALGLLVFLGDGRRKQGLGR
jgi:hypothetical protein